MLNIDRMNKGGRPKGSKNTPKRTLDLRDYIPPKPQNPAKFKITSSQRKLLKEYNPEGLPDFRTKEFKNLSFAEKEDYIFNEIAIAIENRKEQNIIKDYIKIDISTFPNYGENDNNKEFYELLSKFYKIYKNLRGSNVIFRYTYNKEIFITNNFDVPLKNFSKWWKNFSKYGYNLSLIHI